jgi:hypothetical protein
MGNIDGFDGPVPQEISGFELDELEVSRMNNGPWMIFLFANG